MDNSKDSKAKQTGALKGWAGRILPGREKPAVADAPENTPPEQPQAQAPPTPSPAPSRIRKENYLGDTFVIRGELSGNQDVTIDSRVEGKIDLRNQVLRVGAKARIQADIQAANVVVAGSVIGDVVAQDRVEITPAGSVVGSIRSSRISIADGARLKGSVEMVKPAPKVPASKPEAPKASTVDAKPAAVQRAKPSEPPISKASP
ncbi:MAG: polymer-forming cytoskeletal protein [Acidobacteria bacterium]|nr:polymer-forming cytoskeletal protein [Acidobacteriota bacterium]